MVTKALQKLDSKSCTKPKNIFMFKYPNDTFLSRCFSPKCKLYSAVLFVEHLLKECTSKRIKNS